VCAVRLYKDSRVLTAFCVIEEVLSDSGVGDRLSGELEVQMLELGSYCDYCVVFLRTCCVWLAL